ncbi:ATP-binding protein [Kineosporia sp. J2-2]|uniref:ATP-binding protein n=1 Tax=Kineosporia corallincola TaxID=2835133 RepID=A0ABS5TSG0_9ACTN|nr:ATP-binding protein [Kineosporia corallincola]MBT0773752.1 ATP-binding protein [Kineosporia corallincola]
MRTAAAEPPVPPGEGQAGATLFLMTGLPGSGKTTRARRLERERHALRLTPDEWFIPLFGTTEHEDGKRDVLEGRLIWLAMRALGRGVDVVLDFGLWARDERSALRHLAAEAGAQCRLVYLPVTGAEQWRRVRDRLERQPGRTFDLGRDELRRARELFEVPTADEFGVGARHEPPPGWLRWEDWASQRWPTWMDQPGGPVAEPGGRP